MEERKKEIDALLTSALVSACGPLLVKDLLTPAKRPGIASETLEIQMGFGSQDGCRDSACVPGVFQDYMISYRPFGTGFRAVSRGLHEPGSLFEGEFPPVPGSGRGARVLQTSKWKYSMDPRTQMIMTATSGTMCPCRGSASHDSLYSSGSNFWQWLGRPGL